MGAGRVAPDFRANESVGTFAVVGCEDSPSYQVWGARSDLKCSNAKRPKLLDMRFKDWMKEKKSGGQKDKP